MIKGELYRTKLKQRAANDPVMMVILGIGNDNGVFVEQTQFNAYWIDDLVDVSQRTKMQLETKYDKTQDNRPEYVKRKR
jgi:hypothetical protein